MAKRREWPRGEDGKCLTLAEIKAKKATKKSGSSEAGLQETEKPVVTRVELQAKSAEPKPGCPGNGNCPGGSGGNEDEDFSRDEKGRLLSPRERVRRAQLRVLNKIENILDGNCESAKSGNYSCAKFVLDWSGVSDIRSPLAKPVKKKSVLQALLKKFREQDLAEEEKGGECTVE